MSIVTKYGDHGKTRLLTGEDVSKSDNRLNTFGTLDELASFLGLARASCSNKDMAKNILQIQKTLFRLGSELATKGTEHSKNAPIDKNNVEDIEDLVLKYEEEIDLPRQFVIPGSNKSGAILDICRTVCRRFERLLVGFYESGDYKNLDSLMFINRLSDLLFLMARKEEKHG